MDLDFLIFVTAIICFTVYKIFDLRTRRNRYEELKTLTELLEKGIITQKEFDSQKKKILG